ncbi:ABC-three component system protein [Desulfuromonas sp. TF]|uniref:ABC-three component system protein n=1 Tax=Desulfuromonas sp. TF TaxID=1232410 RepID=UPI000410D755|nr:ABC-three component system protein [Desulfuromonas sp. TF]
MNRSHLFNYIEEKLSHLASRIEVRGKLNLLDLHLHSENFYLHFFNELFGWPLENLNTIKPNAEAIDLIDHVNKIVVQVSATATKAKVESALAKDLSAYTGYSFKFISISKDACSLRTQAFFNPHKLVFDPLCDIFDVPSILKYITALDVDDQRRIADFIRKELGAEVDVRKLETNLAAVIKILAKQDLRRGNSAVETVPFKVDEKIEFNSLDASRDIIDDYLVHHSRVDRIYTDFDRGGVNKSLSVLDAIRGYYRAHKSQLGGDALFRKVVDCATDTVLSSLNHEPLPWEELELCVNILAVDAFVRCKIFKNPVGYAHAAS